MNNNDKLLKTKNHIKYLTNQRFFDKAIEEINRYLLDNPKDYYMLAYKAMVYSKASKSKSDEAEDIALTVLQKTSDKEIQAFACETLAIIMENIEDLDSAIYYWKRCIELSKAKYYGKALYTLSKLYYQKGDVEKALGVVKIEGYNTMSFNVARSHIYVGEGDLEKALSALDEETSIKKEDEIRAYAEMKFMRGLIAEKNNSYDEALDYYKEAMKETNNKTSIYWDSLYQSANINYKLKREDRAIPMCEEIIKTCSKVSNLIGTYDLLSDIYINRNDMTRAREVYKDAKLSDMEIIGNAKIDIVEQKYNEALKKLNTIDFKKTDKHFLIYYLYALLMFRLDKYNYFIKYKNLFLGANKDSKASIYVPKIYKMALLFKKRLNLDITNHMDTYDDAQILNYDSENTICHIKEKGEFNNVEKLYDYVSTHLTGNFICDGPYDKYLIDLKDIGYSENHKVVNVLCLANTINIIDITEGSYYCVLEDIKSNEKPKQKRLSAIDKFNKKYGM